MGSNRPRGDDEELLTPEDEEEWEAATRDVRPLAGRAESGPGRGADLPPVGLAERLRERSEKAAGSGEGQVFSLDRRTAERLKRGQIPIEAQLDLHGLTQEEALGALDAFLLESWGLGRRCVLIITGKGTAREGGGVLRTMIPAWLAEGDHRDRILAVQPAQPRDGGEGALYVLLRRQREEDD